MTTVYRIQTLDRQRVEFIDEVIGSGAMKDVYSSPDRSYVVAFFRDRQDIEIRDRLTMIAGRYREGIFNQAGGEYWKDLYCWPTGVVELNGRLGLVAPAYPKHFYFEHGSRNQDFLGIKGREKEGKWFASADNQSRFLDARERGDWLNYIKICIRIARAVRRMHAAGLAHSDLSYKNVLVDPVRGNACVIDIDGLVVPGKYPPDVVGTPDFIAPEVVMTSHLPKGDPARILPSIATDRHALAILIYLYLLYRHPLRGDKVHDPDPQIDETLAMGAKALFVEHPGDPGNRIKLAGRKAGELPWADTSKIPYTVTGPYLAALFDRAFIDGLHDPAQRPTANDWEQALVKTVDLVQPCQNPDCTQKWYVFDNTRAPACPFCDAPYQGKLPVLSLYSRREAGDLRPENHRLMVYTNQSLFPWHMNRHVFPNERLTPDQKKRVGYFVFHADTWWLVNERMPDLRDAATGTPIPVGGKVALSEGLQLLFSNEEGARLVMVQLAEGR